MLILGLRNEVQV